MRLIRALACCSLVLSFAPLALADDKPRDLKLAFKADEAGKLSEVVVNGTAIEPDVDGKRTLIQKLHEQVVDFFFDAKGVRRPGKVETYVEVDGGLRYEHVQPAIDAIREHRKRPGAAPDEVPEPMVDPLRLVVLEENEGRTTLDLQLLEFVAAGGALGRAPEVPIVLEIVPSGKVHLGFNRFLTPEVVRSQLRVKKTFLHYAGHVVKETTIEIRADAQCTMTPIAKVLFAARSQGFEVFAFRLAAAAAPE